MAEMSNCSMERGLGCGFIGRIFNRRSFWSAQKSLPSPPTEGSNNDLKLPISDNHKKPPAENSKKRRSSSAENVLIGTANVAKPSPKPNQTLPRRTSSEPPRLSTSQQKRHNRRSSDAARSSTSSSTSSGLINASKIQDDKRKLSKYPTCNSLELSTVVINSDYQQTNDGKGLTRATSSNIMPSGQLGNLKQLGTGNILGNHCPNATVKTFDYLYKNLQDVPKQRNGESRLGRNGGMGNIVKQPSGEFPQCISSLNKLDPEELKSMGNEAYNKARFEDALALYDRAIAINSSKATYRSNKSAALIGLGRLIEALVECKEAIRIDPSYHRAHHRLAMLYFRFLNTLLLQKRSN